MYVFPLHIYLPFLSLSLSLSLYIYIYIYTFSLYTFSGLSPSGGKCDVCMCGVRADT